jgi:1,2-phenylacetyl-CoA epoxidase PaaB subunit
VRRGEERDVFDAFARFGDQTEPIRWVGSVRAADPELAWHAAKEIYTRREDCSLLWVAARSGMVFSGPEDSEALRTPQRLDYRVPGFPGRHRRDRDRVADVQPANADVRHAH